jgi:hypothetical protein
MPPSFERRQETENADISEGDPIAVEGRRGQRIAQNCGPDNCRSQPPPRNGDEAEQAGRGLPQLRFRASPCDATVASS